MLRWADSTAPNSTKIPQHKKLAMFTMTAFWWKSWTSFCGFNYYVIQVWKMGASKFSVSSSSSQWKYNVTKYIQNYRDGQGVRWLIFFFTLKSLLNTSLYWYYFEDTECYWVGFELDPLLTLILLNQSCVPYLPEKPEHTRFNVWIVMSLNNVGQMSVCTVQFAK